MANNIKLQVGKTYRSRSGREFEILREDYRYPVESDLRFEGIDPQYGDISDSRYSWSADGTFDCYEPSDYDLVSEVVEEPPASTYRYFVDRVPRGNPREPLVWRLAPGARYTEAKYLGYKDDDWDEGVPADSVEFHGFVECDEYGVPLAAQPTAPEEPLTPAPTTFNIDANTRDGLATIAWANLLANYGCSGTAFDTLASKAFDAAEAFLKESRIRNGGAA